MTKKHAPSREEMIREIEKIVANKELSFGCIIQSKYGESIYLDTRPGQLYNIYRPNYKITDKEEKIKIIGHPVMLGDVVDYCEKYGLEGDIEKLYGVEYMPIGKINLPTNIFTLWEDKRKPITEQSDECVKFVYNLIK